MNEDIFHEIFDSLVDKSPYNDSEIARRLGVNRSTVGRWRSGEQSPPLSKIPMIASLFDVHPMIFVGGDVELIEKRDKVILEKFHALDSRGKHTVRTVLDVEYERCTKPHLEVIAAHNDDYSEEQQELIRRDLEKLEALHAKRTKPR